MHKVLVAVVVAAAWQTAQPLAQTPAPAASVGRPAWVDVLASIDDGVSRTYHAGQFFWEPGGHVHTVITTQPAMPADDEIRIPVTSAAPSPAAVV